MTRRSLLSSTLATLAAPAVVRVCSAGEPSAEMSVEGYIFQQYAERRRKTLPDVIDECLAMAHAAGFKNIELNPAFFAPNIRERLLGLLTAQRLSMPSVYVGGSMHEQEAADQTIANALAIGKICAAFGCRAIVNNPDPKRDGQPKTDAELAVQAESLNRMGRALAVHGFQLRVHHHTPQLENNAREWRHILHNTDPRYVSICVDVDWAYEGGFDPISFLSEVGHRLAELHVRSARSKLWLEDVEDSDIDYHRIAAFLREQQLDPLIVVELAYRPNTSVTRPLAEDLRLSRIYAGKVFGKK